MVVWKVGWSPWKAHAYMLHAKKVIVVRLVCYAYTWPHGLLLLLLLCEKSAITFSTYIAYILPIQCMYSVLLILAPIQINRIFNFIIFYGVIISNNKIEAKIFRSKREMRKYREKTRNSFNTWNHIIRLRCGSRITTHVHTHGPVNNNNKNIMPKKNKT